MAAEDRAILQEIGVMDRSRAVDGGQNKAVLGINGRMFLESKMGYLVFDGPVAFQVTRELQRFAIFVSLAFLGIAMCAFLFQLILLSGRLADSTRRASTAMPSLMESPLALNWRRISELICSMAALLSRLRKREKVAWSGEGLLKDRPRNFLKDNLSLI